MFCTWFLYENSKKTALETLDITKPERLNSYEEQDKSLYFHELNDMVCDTIRNNNIPIADAVENKERSGLGGRMVLSRWREKYKLMFDEVVA